MDYQARNWELTIYRGEGTESPLIISNAVAENSAPSLTGRPYDFRKGYDAIETTIRLVPHESITESLDPQENPLRWCKKNRVELRVANSGGNLILHRTLRIAEHPQYDDGLRPTGEQNTTESLTLTLGCLFRLGESRKAPADLSRMAASIDEPLMAVGNRWLRYFGYDEITTLPGDPVPTERVNFSLQYPGNIFPIEWLGQLFYKVGFCTMWVDAQERLRLRKVDLEEILEGSTPDFTLDAPDLYVWNRARQKGEQPAGTVRVLGTTQFVYPYQDPPSVPSTTEGADFTSTSTTSIHTTPLSREVTTTSTTQVSGFGSSAGGSGGASGGSMGAMGTSTEVNYKQYGGGTADIPNPNPVFPATPGTPDYLQYELDTTSEQVEAPAAPGGSGSSLGPEQTTRERRKDYYYKTKSVLTINGTVAYGMEVYKTVETVKVYDPDNQELGSGGTSNLSVESVQNRYWVEIAPDTYIETSTLILPKEEGNKRRTQAKTEPGQSSPPSAEKAPTQLIPKQVQMFGIARFSYPIGAPDNDHLRDLDFGQFLLSNAVAERHAEREGQIMIGRANYQDLGFIPSDEWLADPRPYPVLWVRDREDRQQVFVGDMAVELLGQTSYYLSMAGIKVGSRINSVVTPPFARKVRVLATPDGTPILTPDSRAIRI